MIHIIVRIQPKPDKVEQFLELATYDARNSRKEPGCLRFDVLRQNDAPPRFAFYEVYKDEDAVKAHQQTVDEGVRRCREAGADVVVAVGGGSVMDAAKAVAGVAANDGSVREYLEQVGDRKLTKPPLPLIAVPTTAGSGSEATKNAVIRVPDLKVKRSIRHDLLVPRVAIVDPDLSKAPKLVAASAGLDAFPHLPE